MKQLQQVFKIVISDSNMVAKLSLIDGYREENLDDCSWSKEDVTQFLVDQHITYGHIQENIDNLIRFGSQNTFPLVVAKGKMKEDGENGSILYHYDNTTEIDRSNGWDFREVMRIPTVQERDRLAELIPPTEGTNGRTVYNKELKARPGKPYRMEVGENVVFNELDHCFYATTEGQVSIGAPFIHVHTIYEVNEDISFKIGNIDFLGTVVIHGDVPSGFTIKATGDIKVYGLVESAILQANGSIFVSEGIVGAKQGKVNAKENIYIGYVNQGILHAGNSIYVEQSILHSICTADMEIICDKGNVIGGQLTSGYKIEAKEIGNRLHTFTTIIFGTDNANYQILKSLEKEREQLQENLRKMKVLQFKLKESHSYEPKTLLTLKKLANSYQETENQLQKVNHSISSNSEALKEIDDAYLYVRGKMYPNTVVSFGKYKQTIDKLYDAVLLKIEQNDIKLEPLQEHK